MSVARERATEVVGRRVLVTSVLLDVLCADGGFEVRSRGERETRLLRMSLSRVRCKNKRKQTCLKAIGPHIVSARSVKSRGRLPWLSVRFSFRWMLRARARAYSSHHCVTRKR